MDLRQMTAPCGLGCFACAYFKDNLTEELARLTSEALGVPREELVCEGCRSENGCCFEMPLTAGKGCPTKNCVAEKGLHNCSECDEFPCEHLMPVFDFGDNAPHNTKLYNLSRIKLIGLEAWGKEAALIQQKYFKGKFVYGTAPILEKDS